MITVLVPRLHHVTPSADVTCRESPAAWALGGRCNLAIMSEVADISHGIGCGKHHSRPKGILELVIIPWAHPRGADWELMLPSDYMYSIFSYILTNES